MMNPRLLVVLVLLTVFSCSTEKKIDAQQLIDKTIEVAGGEHYNTLKLSFEFRGKQYFVKRDGGNYYYERRFKDSLTAIHDVVTNKGFERSREGLIKLSVPDSMAAKYTSSINSVQYFALLPYGLNDAAVNKELLEDELINQINYHKVKVTFNQEGGGEDFEDVFIYWINSETFKIDFLAYSYNEADGIGMRFREAYNERYIQNIRFVDYNNYKAEANDVKLTELASLFEADKLKLLSKIENTNIEVE